MLTKCRTHNIRICALWQQLSHTRWWWSTMCTQHNWMNNHSVYLWYGQWPDFDDFGANVWPPAEGKCYFGLSSDNLNHKIKCRVCLWTDIASTMNQSYEAAQTIKKTSIWSHSMRQLTNEDLIYFAVNGAPRILSNESDWLSPLIANQYFWIFKDQRNWIDHLVGFHAENIQKAAATLLRLYAKRTSTRQRCQPNTRYS